MTLRIFLLSLSHSSFIFTSHLPLFLFNIFTLFFSLYHTLLPFILSYPSYFLRFKFFHVMFNLPNIFPSIALPFFLSLSICVPLFLSLDFCQCFSPVSHLYPSSFLHLSLIQFLSHISFSVIHSRFFSWYIPSKRFHIYFLSSPNYLPLSFSRLPTFYFAFSFSFVNFFHRSHLISSSVFILFLSLSPSLPLLSPLIFSPLFNILLPHSFFLAICM